MPAITSRHRYRQRHPASQLVVRAPGSTGARYGRRRRGGGHPPVPISRTTAFHPVPLPPIAAAPDRSGLDVRGPRRVGRAAHLAAPACRQGSRCAGHRSDRASFDRDRGGRDRCPRTLCRRNHPPGDSTDVSFCTALCRVGMETVRMARVVQIDDIGVSMFQPRGE